MRRLTILLLAHLTFGPIASAQSPSEPPDGKLEATILTEERLRFPSVGILLALDHPWKDSKRGVLYPQCTVTLVDANKVLTAAHCFHEITKLRNWLNDASINRCTLLLYNQVRNGDSEDKFRSLDELEICLDAIRNRGPVEDGEKRGTKRGLNHRYEANNPEAEENVKNSYVVFFPHSGFYSIKSYTISHDYRLADLDAGRSFPTGDLASITLSQNVMDIPPTSVALPTKSPYKTNKLGRVGERGIYVGFGATAKNNKGRGLQDIGQIEIESCQHAPDHSAICWISGKSQRQTKPGICTGDSGGPLFVSRDDMLILVGVHSAGTISENCVKGREIIDVRVSSFQYLPHLRSHYDWDNKPGCRDKEKIDDHQKPQSEEKSEDCQTPHYLVDGMHRSIMSVEHGRSTLDGNKMSDELTLTFPKGAKQINIGLHGSGDYAAALEITVSGIDENNVCDRVHPQLSKHNDGNLAISTARGIFAFCSIDGSAVTTGQRTVKAVVSLAPVASGSSVEYDWVASYIR